MSSKDGAMEELFWRDEILQIAYWFQGEGFSEKITAVDMHRFLTPDTPDLEPYLERMVQDGLLEGDARGGYRLTELGQSEGARRFQDAFSEITQPAHGECSPGCACHTTGDPSQCENRIADHVHA